MSLKSRDSYLRRTYGITLEQYDELLANQESRCWICRRHKADFKTALAVDHDHKSGRIRGLLCFNCNKYRVGRNTSNDLPILQRLIEYLNQGTEYYAPAKKRKRRKRRKRR